MDAAAWPLVAVMVAVLVSLVLLAITCLDCQGTGTIPQATNTEESTEFRVGAQAQHTFNRGSAHQTSNHLSPSFSPAVEAGIQQRSRTSTLDTDSNASYENPGDGSGYVNDEFDRESDGYIQESSQSAGSSPAVTGIVVPGEEPNQSGPSTPSLHSYENVPEKKDREYQNVDPQDGSESTSDQSAQSDSDSDDGDMGNYVNVLDASMSG